MSQYPMYSPGNEQFDDMDDVPACPRCGGDTEWIECDQCGGEGMSGHDCGEDCCCCLDPEDNMNCDICDGRGGWDRCLSRKCRERKP